MMGRTIADILNLLPLLIFVPVTFTIIRPEAGNLQAATWIISILILVLSNNFLATFLKRLLGSKPTIVGIVGLIYLAVIALEKTNTISLAVFSRNAFTHIMIHPAWMLILLAYLFATYDIHYNFLKSHLFPEEVQKQKAEQYREHAASTYLKGLGLTGTMLLLEFRLYVRHKKTKTMLYLSPFFILYGLIFYTDPNFMKETGMMMFGGVIITGGMMLNYANYAFGYESSYFDALLSKNIDFSHYIRVKFYIAVLLSTCFYILTIPYVYYGPKVLLINTCMYFYNIGFLSFALLYFATFNKKRIDMNRGGMFNYQGMSSMNWLALLPAFIMPFLIFFLFKTMGHPDLGILFTAVLGIAGLLFAKSLLKIITRNFYNRKYVMAKSFREKD